MAQSLQCRMVKAYNTGWYRAHNAKWCRTYNAGWCRAYNVKWCIACNTEWSTTLLTLQDNADIAEPIQYRMVQQNLYNAYSISTIFACSKNILLNVVQCFHSPDLLKQTFNYRDSLRASFIIYQKGNLLYRPTYFTSSTGEKYDVNRSSVNSLVVSGAFNGIPIVNLTDPIKIFLWIQQVTILLDYMKDWNLRI